MLSTRAFSPPICLACRLRGFLAQSTSDRRVQAARRAFSGPVGRPRPRTAYSQRHAYAQTNRRAYSTIGPESNNDSPTEIPLEEANTQIDFDEAPPVEPVDFELAEEPEQVTAYDIEGRVEEARVTFGDALPEGWLTEEELGIYRRLYGEPIMRDDLATEEAENLDEETGGHAVFREAADGEFEEVDTDSVDPPAADTTEQRHRRMTKADQRLNADISRALASTPSSELHDDPDLTDDTDPDGELAFPPAPHLTGESARAHPLTLAARSGTHPRTLQLSAAAFVQPAAHLLASSPAHAKHLDAAAHRVLGGATLPLSPSTAPYPPAPFRARPVALQAGQAQMAAVEADVFVAAVVPPVYAAMVAGLVEVRRRLGAGWMEGVMGRRGGARMLDVGGGGAGVLGWREVVRAEWARLREQTTEEEGQDEGGSRSPEAPPYGRSAVVVGAPELRGRVSRLLENTTFLPRLPDMSPASSTSIAFTPDVGDETKDAAPGEQQQKKPRQYDLILAPHALLPLREDWERRRLVHHLWRLLDPNGGVLILLEKGVPAGFEAVAGARKWLLERVIRSPGSERRAVRLNEPHPTLTPSSNATTQPEVEETDDATIIWDAPEGPSDGAEKEAGMIVAPCTNHAPCPMYRRAAAGTQGKDVCHFRQRYIRPPFLQRIRGRADAGRNHEDVAFSYLAVMRGVDLRDGTGAGAGDDGPRHGFEQNAAVTDRAFAGYGRPPTSTPAATAAAPSSDADAPSPSTTSAAPSPDHHAGTEATEPHPHPLSLPRTLLPPLKRHGHVILDVCTPAGTLERWTVPKSFGRQAYRDARKAQWGDLWALGAKTRVVRTARGSGTGEAKRGRDADADGDGEVKEGTRKGKVAKGRGGGTQERRAKERSVRRASKRGVVVREERGTEG